MIKYGTKMVEHQTMESFICDKCKKTISDDMGLQEAYSIRFTGGFNSVFGDMNHIGCDLCQNCLYKLIGDFCVYNADE